MEQVGKSLVLRAWVTSCCGPATDRGRACNLCGGRTARETVASLMSFQRSPVVYMGGEKVRDTVVRVCGGTRGAPCCTSVSTRRARRAAVHSSLITRLVAAAPPDQHPRGRVAATAEHSSERR